MTNTTTATRIYTIPATGLEHRSGNVVITATPTAQSGYRIQVRIGGVFNAELSSAHTFQTDALRVWDALVAQYPAPAEPAPVVAIPGNVGTTMRVSDPSHIALAVAATSPDCTIQRGGKFGQATDTQIRSLHKKGFMDPIIKPGTRFTITGGVITSAGRTRLAQLTAADRALADFTARLAANLAFDQTAASATPVAA